jgi:hypothetical protein
VTGGSSGAFYPEPSARLRLAGVAALVGAVLWPVTLIVLSNAAQGCIGATACTIDRSALGLMAISPVLLAIGAAGLELRARHELGLGDLVGDLTVGTSALLFVLAFVTGITGLVGPGLLLLLIGSLIFGIVGYVNGARHRLASAVVAIGAGFVLLFVVLGAGGAAGGGGGAADTTSVLALVLFSLGWGWLGANLMLGRPLAILERRARR